MRSFLSDREVLGVLHSLGYGNAAASSEPSEADLAAYAAARTRYRAEHGRLFPTWSEVLQLLLDLGYRRSRATRPDGPRASRGSGRLRPAR